MHADKNIKSNTTLFDVNSLFEFSRIVNSSSDLDFVLSHFLLTAMGKLLCTKGILFLRKNGKKYKVGAVRGMGSDSISELQIGKPFKKILYKNLLKKNKSKWTKTLLTYEINLLIPLVSKNKIIGIAAFRRLIDKKLNKEEETYLQSLSNIATAAIEQKLNIDELKLSNKELDRKIHQMNTLFDLSKELNIILDRDKLIRLVTLSLLGQMGVSKYFVCIRENNTMKILSSRLNKPIDDKFMESLCEVNLPNLTDQIENKKTKKTLENHDIKVVIPMKLQNETKGIFALGPKMNDLPYTRSDLDFLFSLGNLAIISIENTRLFKEALEKQKMEDDLIIAREIQKGLLPKKFPVYKGIDIAAVNIPSKQVGGDYYDVIECGENKFIVAIADVSGKGTPAALLMANLQAMIRALVPLGLPLSDLTHRVNDLIFASTTVDRFITFFWGCVDTQQRKINYVNAGHNPPILLHQDGLFERLEEGGLICGVMKTTIPYNEGKVKYFPGDVLILFTDGVSEAMDKDSIEFGEDRIISIVKYNMQESSKVILNNIVESVKQYSGDFQSDDITLLVLKVN